MQERRGRQWPRLVVLFVLGLTMIAYTTNVASVLASLQANGIEKIMSTSTSTSTTAVNSSRALFMTVASADPPPVTIDCSTVSPAARRGVANTTMMGPAHSSFLLSIVNESSSTNIACLPPNVINHHVVNMNGRERLGQGEKILVLGLPYTDKKARVSSFLQASQQRFRVCHNYCEVPIDMEHHWTGNLTTKRASIGSCLQNATEQLALPPLKTCGNYDVYDGLAMTTRRGGANKKCILPQVTMLQEFHNEYPDATFVLNLVTAEQWIAAGRLRHTMVGGRGKIVRRGPAMVQDLIQNDDDGYGCDAGPKSDDDATLRQYYHYHVQRVRQFVAQHPSHALVEVDVQNNDQTKTTTASRMATLFGIDASLWGKQQSFNRKSKSKPAKEVVDAEEDEIPPYIARTLPIVQEQTAGNRSTSLAAHVVNHHVVNHNGRHPLGQGEKIILLGLPGNDPTFVTSFFQHSERYSKMCSHKCNLPIYIKRFKDFLLGNCLQKASKKGLPNPIATCGDYNLLGEMYVSVNEERGGYKCALPQISMLELFHKEHPDATFVLNIMDAWHWSNMIIEQNIHRDLERCPDKVGPGEEPSQFDLVQWYYQHVQRVRQFVTDHPTHALVEVDVMNHLTTTQRMTNIFGLGSADNKALSAS